jgi:hypothetical protein
MGRQVELQGGKSGLDRVCQIFCVRAFREIVFGFREIGYRASIGMEGSLPGGAERSSPATAERRAEGAGLDGDSVRRAIIGIAVISPAGVISRTPESARRSGWRTRSSLPSIQRFVAI